MGFQHLEHPAQNAANGLPGCVSFIENS